MRKSHIRAKPSSAEKRRVAHERAEWLMEHNKCMVCRKADAVDVHEIARGANRQEAWRSPCCWISACRKCHNEMDDYGVWPIARQLALKKMRDSENYDRVAVNRIRSRDDEAISEVEVDSFCF